MSPSPWPPPLPSPMLPRPATAFLPPAPLSLRRHAARSRTALPLLPPTASPPAPLPPRCCAPPSTPANHDPASALPPPPPPPKAEGEPGLVEATGEPSALLDDGPGPLGNVALDDEDLQAALSKQWDNLSLFDHTEPLPDVAPASTTDADTVAPAAGAGAANGDGKSKEDGLAGAAHVMPAEAAHTGVLDPDNLVAGDDAAAGDAAAAPAKPKKKRGRKPGAKTKAKSGGASSRKTVTSVVADDAEEPELVAELLNDEEWDESPRWYFVQVKPSCEKSCAISIRNMSTSMERLDILEVLVPSTKIMRLTKGGKTVEKEERFFPGYILVLMVMNRATYSNILRVPNVQWFMGDPNRDKKKDAPFRPPLPVSDAEMSKVFQRIRNADSTDPELKTKIRPGDFVRVIAGQFEKSEGTVLEVKPDINVVKCNLILFGRWSAMELEFEQLEVIDELTVLPKATSEDLKEDDDSFQSKNKDTKSRRRRVQSMVGDVDYNNAEVASSADDLALLLADDASNKWDPEGVEPLPEDARVMENSDADYDEFVSAVSIENEPSRSKKGSKKKGRKSTNDEFDDLFSEGGLFSSEDDLGRALSKEGESDIWGSDFQDPKKNKRDDNIDEDFDALTYQPKLEDLDKKAKTVDLVEEPDLDPEVDDILKGVFDDIDDNMDFGDFDDDNDDIDDGFVSVEQEYESNEDGLPGKKKAIELQKLREMSDVLDATLSDKQGKFDVGKDLDDFGDPVVLLSEEDEAIAGSKVDITKKPDEDEFLDVDKLRDEALREANLYAHEHGPGHVLRSEDVEKDLSSKSQRKAKSKR